MVTYEIQVIFKGNTQSPMVRRFDVRQKALDAWDMTVENTLPGDTARLIHIDGEERKTSSSYAPCDRNHEFPTGVHGQ